MAKYYYETLANYKAQDLFKLVANIEDYPKFLPWCLAAKITSQNENIIIADLMIKFKFLREKYSSKVTLIPDQEIKVEAIEGPFEYLNNSWKFINQDEQTLIKFEIDFKFSSSILEAIASSMIKEASHKIMNGFLRRASEIYDYKL